MSSNARRLLMCPPQFFDVEYEINPWMHLACQPVTNSADEQWAELRAAFLRLGAVIEDVAPVKVLPDMVYTANAGLVHGTNVVLSRFRFPERQGEEPIFQAWFEKQGFTVLKLTDGFFEGAGDALFAGDLLFAGHGFRSDEHVAKEVCALLNISEWISCQLVDPRFYHLDTCFCPLSDRLALGFEAAFSADSLQRIKQHVELIAVPEEEAVHFACNAVVLSSDIVMPVGCPKTYARLEAHG